MSDTTWWLGHITALALGSTVLALGVLLFQDPGSPGWRALRQRSELLDGKLRFLRSTVRGRQVVSAQVAAASLCLVVGVAVPRGWPALLLLPPVLLGPAAVLESRSAERIARLEAQIEPWLNAIVNALKASSSLGEAIASSISLVQAPMSEEIDVVVKEYELGTPLDHALSNFGDRVGSETLAGTILALQVARRSGGNLPAMLENAASALRELARLEGVVRAKTAEGRAQAFVIGAIPAPMVGGLHLIDPQFFHPLATNFLGNLVVGAAAVLWVLAIVAARKILAVDV